MKCLNAVLEFTLTSSFTSKRNMKKSTFLPNSSPVQPYRPLQAKFYKTFKPFQNKRGTNSTTMHVENSGWRKSNFQDLLKKQNTTSTQHNILFSCSEDVKLTYQRQSFVSLKRMKKATTENVANANCFTN